MDSVLKMINDDRATKYQASEFEPKFLEDMEHDLKVLKEIDEMWSGVYQDPKLDEFVEVLKTDQNLINSKILIFTESKETAFYLEKELNPLFDDKVMAFSGESSESARQTIIKNFDANHRNPDDDYRILISTDVLSQGVNLHRSNVVINYDIPWNPTRMMQRVGRVQRVDTKFDEIFIYNFFPAGQINKNISLEEAAESKIAAFIEMLGNDSRLLTDEEIKSHDLFDRLTSKETITGEEEEEDHELKYLTFLRKIRDEEPDLFEKIKRLPRKARTGRLYPSIQENSLVTFFKSGNLRKIYQTINGESEELDFLEAALILEVDPETKSERIDPEFYDHLDLNKEAFDSVFEVEEEPVRKGGSVHARKLTKIIKAILQMQKEFTELDEEYLEDVLQMLDDGILPPVVIKKLNKEINKTNPEPLAILAKIKANIPEEYFQDLNEDVDSVDYSHPREVILSEYLIKGG